MCLLWRCLLASCLKSIVGYFLIVPNVGRCLFPVLCLQRGAVYFVPALSSVGHYLFAFFSRALHYTYRGHTALCYCGVMPCACFLSYFCGAQTNVCCRALPNCFLPSVGLCFVPTVGYFQLAFWALSSPTCHVVTVGYCLLAVCIFLGHCLLSLVFFWGARPPAFGGAVASAYLFWHVCHIMEQSWCLLCLVCHIFCAVFLGTIVCFPLSIGNYYGALPNCYVPSCGGTIGLL